MKTFIGLFRFVATIVLLVEIAGCVLALLLPKYALAPSNKIFADLVVYSISLVAIYLPKEKKK